MTSINTHYIASPIGTLRLEYSQGALNRLTFVDQQKSDDHSHQKSFIAQLYHALASYWQDPNYSWQINLAITGTKFQQRVWQALRSIPSGEVRHYQQLADEIGSHARPIANACRQNPIPLIIPCHRVVAKNNLGGYAGETEGRMMEIKKWLLRHEGVALAEPS